MNAEASSSVNPTVPVDDDFPALIKAIQFVPTPVGKFIPVQRSLLVTTLRTRRLYDALVGRVFVFTRFLPVRR